MVNAFRVCIDDLMMTVGTHNLIYTGYNVCALFIAIVVLVNYSSIKKIYRSTSYLFLALIIFTLVSTTFNLLAILTLSVFNCPAWVGNVMTICYYFSYMLTGVVFAVYTAAVFYEGRKIPRPCYIVANSMVVIGLGASIFSAVCLFGIKPNVSESAYEAWKCGYEGAIYGTVIIACLFSLVLVLKHAFSKGSAFQLRRSSVINVCFFCCLNVIAVLVQYVLLRTHQVSNFALSVVILIMYITLQRPEDEIDAMSGAFNGRSFTRRGNMLLSENRSVLVFAFEINNMAVVNSSFGINNGNRVVREAVSRIKKLLPKGQYLYRLSGVRFATFFLNEENYEKFAQKYATVFEEPFSIEQTEMRLSATACLVKMPEVTEKLSEVEDLVRYYRNSVNVSESIIEADSDALQKARRRELVDFAIQNAIINGSFEVYYQPIYSVKDKNFSGCEALIRLNDPMLGFISPDEFIPISEQNGKIIDVGRFVIEEVCRFIKQEKIADYGIKFVDVNLSVIQCMHPEIINDINGILNKYEVPRSMVNLEITETASAQSYALLQSKLNELHSNGFTISLDDFGTGFSSVEYLIDFPFDIVKLDKALVWAYMSTKKYEPILQHYMPMLHSLGTKIVAEGVETLQMVEALEALGCDYLQGYYYSRPVSGDIFLQFISERNRGEKLA